MILSLFSKDFLEGHISRSLFYCSIAEMTLSEITGPFEPNFTRVAETVDLIELKKDHPWVPLFVFSEGRDKFATGAWTRYMESAEWNRYNELKERVEARVAWRSYEHQKDYFRVYLKHLEAIVGAELVQQTFPNLLEVCQGDMSDSQWKTRHLVLYAHGNMSTAIKWLRCLRLKSR